MKVTVAVTTHNSERVIGPTLDAVLSQTHAPYEVIVLDDGSTDSTVSFVKETYGDAIRLIQQPSKGVSAARNALCEAASGDLIAFLDHDDIWHPTYLEVQARHFEMFPDAVAFYTEHLNFYGYGRYDWSRCEPGETLVELIPPTDFLWRYNTTSARFGSASFLCVPREVLVRIGPEPFKIDHAEDAYFAMWFPMLGSVCYSATPLVAYRITEKSLSSDKVTVYRAQVEVLEEFAARYEAQGYAELSRLLPIIFASKRRHYAKRLMGAGEHAMARRQLRLSLTTCPRIGSMAKSMGLLLASFLPGRLQPKWPEPHRAMQDSRAS